MASAKAATPAFELRVGGRRLRFDPERNDDLQRIAREIKALENEAADKKLRRGLQQIERLAAEVADAPDAATRSNCLTALLETALAINNSQRPAVPARIESFQALWAFLDQLHRPVGHGRARAANLEPGPDADLSRCNPLPSTFWQPPGNIAKADLYHGFGRANCLELEQAMCAYSGPKESQGTNPGFEVNWNGRTVKLKFGELCSEPFTARIFAALGFHVDPTDYARQARVRYDRRIFREFHSRQPLQTRFTVMGATYYTLDLQKRYDPFAYLACAVLRDGTSWTGRELKTRLFRDSRRPHPEDDAGNFRPEVEAAIDHLVTVPANVQLKESGVKSIGQWDFGQLDHADRRELRGAGLLAAWLGFFDTRFENTRLKLAAHGGRTELAHYFSDLGGGLGQTSGLIFCHGERPNEFPWTFTQPSLWQGPGRMARPLRITGYKPTAATPPFTAMTLDDARWMARLIAQLTEEQIVQALVASGYESAEVRLYAEKLISRRDRMCADLNLSDEFPPLRPDGVNRQFSYDAQIEGPISVNVPGSGPVSARVGILRVVKGKLEPRDKSSPAPAEN